MNKLFLSCVDSFRLLSSRTAVIGGRVSRRCYTKEYSIGLIPGDGIGKELIPFAVELLNQLSTSSSSTSSTSSGHVKFTFKEYPFSCEYYQKYGHMLSDFSLQNELPKHDAILLGAVGNPNLVRDDISLRGLLIPIRQKFDLYVNLRPTRTLPGVQTHLRQDKMFDITIVRENSEGEYSGMGGRFKMGSQDEMALQTSVFTRKGIERIIRYAFEYAAHHSSNGKRHVTLATKSNAMQHGFVLWDEIFDEIALNYGKEQLNCTFDKFHIDALSAKIITHPEHFDVIVASNLFGDILSDQLGAMQGSLGIPASANINPNPDHPYPSLFESVHGSAPDIIGLGIANPVATFQACALMLKHLSQDSIANKIINAIEKVTEEGNKSVITPDLGGQGTTLTFANEIMKKI